MVGGKVRLRAGLTAPVFRLPSTSGCAPAGAVCDLAKPSADSLPQEGADMLKEFREFAVRGNVVDMAVGIIIGAAFGTIVKSLVSDVVMPPIGLLLGKVDFTNLFVVLREGASAAGPYASLAAAQAAGAVTINYGAFVNTVISFVIVAFSVFLLVRQVNRFKRVEAPGTRDCPYCFSAIPVKATRCGLVLGLDVFRGRRRRGRLLREGRGARQREREHRRNQPRSSGWKRPHAGYVARLDLARNVEVTDHAGHKRSASEVF